MKVGGSFWSFKEGGFKDLVKMQRCYERAGTGECTSARDPGEDRTRPGGGKKGAGVMKDRLERDRPESRAALHACM